METSSASPAPCFNCFVFSMIFRVSSSAAPSCTYSLSTDEHDCPELQNAPHTAAPAASSRFASSKTIIGSLPPSSSTTDVRFLAAASAIFLPVATEPVNMILSGAASTNAAPVAPAPLTICTRFDKLKFVGLSAAFSNISPIFKPTIGVSSDGFITTVFPAIRAIAASPSGIENG